MERTIEIYELDNNRNCRVCGQSQYPIHAYCSLCGAKQ